MQGTVNCVFAVLVAAVLPSHGGWEIPDPAALDHPGVAEAPSSDPRTYPDAEGFKRRSELIVQGVSSNFLGSYRKGWFGKGGDPGKYTIPIAMARLIQDPDEPEARRYMNDDRTFSEHYHFAAVNWARFYPLFGAVLTPETRKRFEEAAANNTPYLESVGTENHKVMWLTSANVLPCHVSNPRFAKRPVDEAKAQAKAKLRRYVKDLYAVGQGEWDSSTYMPYDVDGMLNIYDFSRDPECRLLARAVTTIDGRQVEFGNWPVYGGPFLKQSGGVLSITDGKAGYSIDFSGDLPVYRELAAVRK